MSYESLGQWMKQRRKELDLTQKQLAAQVGVATITVRKLEAGELHPSRELVERLAIYLEIPKDDRETFSRLARGMPIPSPAGKLPGGSSPRHPTNLVAALNSLVGRERDLAHICGLLLRDDIHLLAVCGPPGIGKTRLSQQAGRELLESFSDGVFFVALAPIHDTQLVTATIAQALGVPETPGQTLVDSLKVSLRDKQLLLILDNFEHVLEAAPLITELLAAAHRLKALVTSREVLSLYGEYDFWLPPLDLPAPEMIDDLEALEQVASVQLFLQRARAANPDFHLNRANAAAIAELCTRLDGLPLAIELAASRSSLFGPRALLKRIDQRFELLTTRLRDLPPRQRTLHGAIEWSYDLLDEGEKRLYRRLGVFAGSFDLEAAAALCAPDLGGLAEATEGIESLVNKSLVTRLQPGSSREEPYEWEGEPRFLLLETIRVHAREQLEAMGEDQAALQRHAGYYLALAETPHRARAGPQSVERLDRLEVERPNLLAALGWFIDQKDVEKSLRLAGALVAFWAIHGYMTEGRQFLRAALSLAEEAPVDPAARSALAFALNGAGHLAYDQDDPKAAFPLIEASLELWRDLGDEHHVAWALYGLGLAILAITNPSDAHNYLDKSLAVSRRAGDRWCMARALELKGVVHLYEGFFPQALDCLDEGLQIFRELNDLEGAALARMNQGHILLLQGHPMQAQDAFEECLAIFRQLGYRRMMSMSLMFLGEIAYGEGDLETASFFMEESQAISKQIGLLAMISYNYAFMALVRRLQGNTPAARELVRKSMEEDFEHYVRSFSQFVQALVDMDEGRLGQAASLLKECLVFNHSKSDQVAVVDDLEVMARLSTLAGQPQAAARLLGAAQARRDALGTPRPPVIRPEYEQVISAARAALGEEGFNAAWEEGKLMPFEQAVSDALEWSEKAAALE